MGNLSPGKATSCRSELACEPLSAELAGSLVREQELGAPRSYEEQTVHSPGALFRMPHDDIRQDSRRMSRKAPQEAPANAEAQFLGTRIRGLRKRRGMTPGGAGRTQ